MALNQGSRVNGVDKLHLKKFSSQNNQRIIDKKNQYQINLKAAKLQANAISKERKRLAAEKARLEAIKSKNVNKAVPVVPVVVP